MLMPENTTKETEKQWCNVFIIGYDASHSNPPKNGKQMQYKLVYRTCCSCRTGISIRMEDIKSAQLVR